MTTVLGVDGWKGSWVGAYVRNGQVAWATGRFGALVAAEPFGSVSVAVGVDIPVGLATSGRRGCDLAAKAALGAASSRVFLMPPAFVFDAPSHAAGNLALRAAREPAISIQAWGLRAAVLEVAGYAADERVFEVHPELSFLALAGQVLAGKKTAAGVAQRIEALSGWVDVLAALAAAPPRVPVDDALDALAAAWSAERIVAGSAVGYPVTAPLLSTAGRPMRIHA